MAIEGYDLFDRLFLENPIDPVANPSDYEAFDLSGHLIDAVLVDYAETKDDPGGTTRAQIINGLLLGTEATVDLDALLAGIDGVGSAFGKVRFALNFAAVHSAAQSGLKYTDKASFKTRLGI